MSVLPVGIGSSGGYEITNSVRLRAAASAYFSRTFGAPTNNKKWHYRCLVKRGTLGAVQTLISADAVNDDQFFFNSTDTLRFQVNGTVSGRIETTAVFRDPSAWYDIELLYDSANATSTDRAIIKVNGVRQTVTVTTAITLDYNSHINSAIAHNLGRFVGVANYCDLYKADEFFIDGSISGSFGETNADGVWVPKAYSGTYGTNGFHLDFKDANLTAGSNVGLGKDVSGNGNYWTTNNISVTAGVTYDSMVDTPTNNYATLNPIDGATSCAVPVNGNLKSVTTAGALAAGHAGTIAVFSGKQYWECEVTGTTNAAASIGVLRAQLSSATLYSTNPSATLYVTSGNKNIDGTQTAYGTAWSGVGTTYTIGMALDADAGTLTFYLNNVSQGAVTLPSNSGLGWKPAHYHQSSTGYSTFEYNFGQRPFTYTPPTGFKALCTANLSAVSIPNPRKHFDAVLDTGANIKTTVQALFTDELAWVKDRANSNNHQLMDSVRGVNAVLQSNTTAAETTYSAPAGSSVGWAWKANGAGSSNTDGSITSTVSANQTAGFSIVTYTGTGAAGTVGHGLGAAPAMIIYKDRGAIGSWPVMHTKLANMTAAYVKLNATDATANLGSAVAAPTTTTFGVSSSTSAATTCVAYCFAEIAGYSKFGSYVGNGSADGPFVYCGFRPKYIMAKRVDSTSNWRVWDTARNTSNVIDKDLYPNASNLEATLNLVDATANGFKIRHAAGSALNESGGTYIFAAFPEFPFGGSNVSPSPAR